MDVYVHGSDKCRSSLQIAHMTLLDLLVNHVSESYKTVSLKMSKSSS